MGQDLPPDLTDEERWIVFGTAGWVTRPYVRRLAKGRKDCWWMRRIEQCIEVLSAAVQNTTSIRTMEMNRGGWAVEAQVAELAGQLARAAWLSRGAAVDGNANEHWHQAVTLGKQLSELGHGPFAQDIWKAIRCARAEYGQWQKERAAQRVAQEPAPSKEPQSAPPVRQVPAPVAASWDFPKFRRGDIVKMKGRTGTVLDQEPVYGSTKVQWEDGRISRHKPHLLKKVELAEMVGV